MLMYNLATVVVNDGMLPVVAVAVAVVIIVAAVVVNDVAAAIQLTHENKVT